MSEEKKITYVVTHIRGGLFCIESEGKIDNQMVFVRNSALDRANERIKELEQIGARKFKVNRDKFVALESRISNLRAAIKDAEYILQGSRAIPGQSDKELEAREQALMRFLDAIAADDKAKEV